MPSFLLPLFLCYKNGVTQTEGGGVSQTDLYGVSHTAFEVLKAHARHVFVPLVGEKGCSSSILLFFRERCAIGVRKKLYLCMELWNKQNFGMRIM